MLKDRFVNRQKTATLKGNRRFIIGRIISVLCPLSFILCLSSCNPEAPWTTKNVEIKMAIQTVSAGFIECEFSTNKNAYYFVNAEPARKHYNPLDYQKQFMVLTLDSANLEYLNWRHQLLEEGTTHVAPFASHSLQYGSIHHFFTALEPGTDYWVYAFVVNPDKLEPTGKLYLTSVKTADSTVLDVHFEYRVLGSWDYTYPVDSTGKIYPRFPYLAATEDSAKIAQSDSAAIEYFDEYFMNIMDHKLTEYILYGVKAVHNDGEDSSLKFQEGHTYYTAIAGWDGLIGRNVIYKFTWTGEHFEAYFKDADSIVSDGEDD